ncbi:MAG: tyrosine-type recombinase/integrase [Coleofasciculus sp. A1-SPW-01]|uniref:tyrosine-type recombinase/integrase n=1 Tax=Coleofasciculus sp. A1-SPW-01 TaxID=3070819 RepID=UPI003304B6A9
MRNPKGTVVVEQLKGRLRLRLPRFCPTRYLSLGLADNARNRKIASAKAGQIEADITMERFDPTLERYKSPYQRPVNKIPLMDIWQAYVDRRSLIVSLTTINTDFARVTRRLEACPVLISESKKIEKWLANNYTPGSARRILCQLRAACNWAMEEGLIEVNPFKQLPKSQVFPSIPDPFTREERDLIIRGFNESVYYRHYTDFVRFLFWTGCRTSEAVGLQWRHIDQNLKFIIFNEALVNGIRKDTKTHKSRRFPVNQAIRILLEDRQPDPPDIRRLIFRSKNGLAIDSHNFLNRAWRSVLGKLPIRYRKQYCTRATFITLCLEEGVPVAQVATWVGNSPKTIWQHYAGIVSAIAVPEP